MQIIKKAILSVLFLAMFLMSAYAAWSSYTFRKQYSSANAVSNASQNQVIDNVSGANDNDYTRMAVGFNGFLIKIEDSLDKNTGKPLKKMQLKGGWKYDSDSKSLDFSKDDESIASVVVNEQTEIISVPTQAEKPMVKIELNDLKEVPENYGITVEFSGQASQAIGGGIAKKIIMMPITN